MVQGPGDEIFLDMFEDEYNNEKLFSVKVLFLMQDASMLLPPTDTPLSGIEFTRRLPCGENERARKAMRVFFAVRSLTQELSDSEERDLPLTMPSNSATVGEIVDLSEFIVAPHTATCSLLAFPQTTVTWWPAQSLPQRSRFIPPACVWWVLMSCLSLPPWRLQILTPFHGCDRDRVPASQS